jgi:hypothetical protein
MLRDEVEGDAVQFVVLVSGQRQEPSPLTLVLEPKDWDDGGFRTLFELYYRDAEGVPKYIGEVKVGRVSTGSTPEATILPVSFEQLDQWHFSLGQDSSYYEQLNDLGQEIRDEVLRALNDMALDPAVFARAMSEPVTTASLLRNVFATASSKTRFDAAVSGVDRADQASYSLQAAVTMSGDRLQLERLLQAVGWDGVRDELVTRADSRRSVNVNSWQVALYDALAASTWYCTGGFRF